MKTPQFMSGGNDSARRSNTSSTAATNPAADAAANRKRSLAGVCIAPVLQWLAQRGVLTPAVPSRSDSRIAIGGAGRRDRRGGELCRQTRVCDWWLQKSAAGLGFRRRCEVQTSFAVDTRSGASSPCSTGGRGTKKGTAIQLFPSRSAVRPLVLCSFVRRALVPSCAQTNAVTMVASVRPAQPLPREYLPNLPCDVRARRDSTRLARFSSSDCGGNRLAPLTVA